MKYHTKNMSNANVEDVDYAVRLMEEENHLSENELLILRNLKVGLKHESLPQHQIEKRAGTHAPSREQILQFQKLSQLKRGTYSPQEDETIVSNWKSFCESHNWNPKNVKPFLVFRKGTYNFIRKESERHKFVQFLADGLPNRTLYSVLNRFRTLNDTERLQRRYNREEDETIIDYIEKNPNLDKKKQFVYLSKFLNRTRASVWRRYRLLKIKRDRVD